MNDLYDRFRRQPRVVASIGIVGIVLLAALLLAVSVRSVSAMAIAVFDIDQSAGPDPGVNLREVARNGDAMCGYSVTVSAKVHDISSPHAATIGGSTPFFGSVLLIVSQEPLDTYVNEPLGEDDVVRVTGVVQPFDLAALEGDLGIALPDDLAEQYSGKSGMVVEEMSVDPPAAFGPSDKEFPFESDGWDSGVTISDIADDPDGYLGETVKVSGEVEDIEDGLVTQHAFRIGSAKLLVITPEPREDLFVEPTAYVTGEVRQFDLAAVEGEFAIDLDEALLSQYNGDPVIIANEVELVK